MATSSQQAVPATAAAVGGTASAIDETVVGSHVFRIDGFSATKDLGVGKSIRSSTFQVGRHDWYIKCYPCGADEDSAGWVSLKLRLCVHKDQVEAGCYFTLVLDNVGCKDTHSDWIDYCGYGHQGIDLMEREKLEQLLKDDCFQIRCDMSIVKEFFAVQPPLDMHPPLSRRGDQHRYIRTTYIFGSMLPFQSNTPIAKLHYSWFMHDPGECVQSEYFHIGKLTCCIRLFPSGETDKDINCLAIFLVMDPSFDSVVKVRFELTLLTLAREIISSTQSCYSFSSENENYECRCYLPLNMEPELSPLLLDSFHVKCDVTIIKEITPMGQRDVSLLARKVGTDVTFEIGRDLFPAHKLVLATRSSVFMADFFRSASQDDSACVRIEDMEPRVFRALLHFIYTDTLPDEVLEGDDRVVLAQGLLASADRYAMERLKLICADMLCNYIKDARTALDAMKLADKHGCRRLKEVCVKILIRGQQFA